MYRRNKGIKQAKELRKKAHRTRAIDKADRDEWKWTIEEKFDNEIKLDKEKVQKIVPQKFHKWLKVFKKDRIRENISENISEKALGSCDQSKRRFCAKEGKDIDNVERRKGGSKRIYGRIVEKRIYSTLKIATNIIYLLCKEKKWKEKDGTELQIPEQEDNQRQLPPTFNFRLDRHYRNKQGIHKDGFAMGIQ